MHCTDPVAAIPKQVLNARMKSKKTLGMLP